MPFLTVGLLGSPIDVPDGGPWDPDSGPGDPDSGPGDPDSGPGDPDGGDGVDTLNTRGCDCMATPRTSPLSAVLSLLP